MSPPRSGAERSSRRADAELLGAAGPHGSSGPSCGGRVGEPVARRAEAPDPEHERQREGEDVATLTAATTPRESRPGRPNASATGQTVGFRVSPRASSGNRRRGRSEQRASPISPAAARSTFCSLSSAMTGAEMPAARTSRRSTGSARRGRRSPRRREPPRARRAASAPLLREGRERREQDQLRGEVVERDRGGDGGVRRLVVDEPVDAGEDDPPAMTRVAGREHELVGPDAERRSPDGGRERAEPGGGVERGAGARGGPAVCGGQSRRRSGGHRRTLEPVGLDDLELWAG